MGKDKDTVCLTTTAHTPRTEHRIQTVLDLVDIVLIIIMYADISVMECGDETEIDIHFLQREDLR